MSRPLRLLLYDRTCKGGAWWPGLSHTWWCGAWCYRGLGRLDGHFGASNWDEAIEWLASVAIGRSIQEVQFWGHGKWGDARIGEQAFDTASLGNGGSLRSGLQRVRSRLRDDGQALWWFRTCETFGAVAGQAFAAAVADFMGCRVAGHTHIIAHWQSGLHSLQAGEQPTWPDDEGLVEGTPAHPVRAAWSRPWHPNTITCWRGSIPPGY